MNNDSVLVVWPNLGITLGRLGRRPPGRLVKADRPSEARSWVTGGLTSAERLYAWAWFRSTRPTPTPAPTTVVSGWLQVNGSLGRQPQCRDRAERRLAAGQRLHQRAG